MKLDKRTKTYKYLSLWHPQYTLSACMWGILVGTFLMLPYTDSQLRPSKPLETIIKPEVAEVKAYELPCDYSPLVYLRCRGQELGYDDYTISTFIEIARAESGFNLDQYAKNPNSTSKGIYQFIDGTWRAYCLKGGNVYNFVDNIDCFFKVLEVDGYPKGLSHWASSKSKWSQL